MRRVRAIGSATGRQVGGGGRAARPAAVVIVIVLVAALGAVSPPIGPVGAIQGGQLLTADEAPDWAVALRLHRGDGRVGLCSGSLIAADAVLTAAHCLFDDQGRPNPRPGDHRPRRLGRSPGRCRRGRGGPGRPIVGRPSRLPMVQPRRPPRPRRAADRSGAGRLRRPPHRPHRSQRPPRPDRVRLRQHRPRRPGHRPAPGPIRRAAAHPGQLVLRPHLRRGALPPPVVVLPGAPRPRGQRAHG